MPKRMDESLALADVYAAALLGAATERGVQDEVAEAFNDLVDYMDRDPEFELFLTARSVDDDPRRQSLEKLFRGRMNDLLLNLLQVLNNRERLWLIRGVHRCVVLRMERRRHQQEVVIETAMPLAEDLKAALQSRLSARIGKEALLIERVVPDLVGGVVIHIDDLQIDGSVTMRMRTLRERLSERAVHEIHNQRLYVES